MRPNVQQKIQVGMCTNRKKLGSSVQSSRGGGGLGVAKGKIFLQAENEDWSDCADAQTGCIFAVWTSQLEPYAYLHLSPKPQ